MTLYDRCLAEAVRCYGYPAELRKGAMGVSASGAYGGLWCSAPQPRHRAGYTPNRHEARGGLRELLEMLRAQPSLDPWRPWCRWAFAGQVVSDLERGG